MQRIASDHGHVHVLHNYVYRLNNSRAGTSYYKCIKATCQGRASIHGNGHVDVSPHNHEADEVEVDMYHLKNEIKRIVLEMPNRSPRDVFNIACERFPRAAARVGFPNVRTAIYRHRSRGVPPIPNSLQGLQLILQEDRWRHWNTVLASEDDQGDTSFFRTVVGGGEAGWSAGIYMSARLATALANTERLHIDATFKTVPGNLQATQLLSIHAEHMGHLFPVVFALMDRKIQTAYQGVYSWVREAIPAWAPRVILADFESAMRNAAQLTWHPQQMTGCWFHFAQAIFRMHSRLGMIRLTEENIEANWALHMLMALPLLPAERIVTGLAVVCHYVRVHNLENNFRALLGYLDNYWVRTVGVENFSVHGQTHRTNNALEGFYSNLVHVMGPHPGMWHFHDHLKRVELANWQDLQRLQNNVPHVRPRRRVYQRQDANIRDAQNRLELGQYTEAQFLHRMAHSTRSLAERTFRNQRAPAAPAAQALPAVPLMPPNLAPAGQQPAGPQAAGPQPAGPQPAGPQPAGPQAAGPQPVGPQPAGPQAAGPHPAGPQAAGTQPAGQQPVEPHPAEPQPAADPREPGTCTICLAEPAGRVAIPCGHYCVCPACVHILVERGEDTRCPFCRANIIGFFNVFTNL